MARKRAVCKESRGHEPRSQKAKGRSTAQREEKEAGESEAKLGLGADAEGDPAAGLGFGERGVRPVEMWGRRCAARIFGKERTLPEAGVRVASGSSPTSLCLCPQARNDSLSGSSETQTNHKFPFAFPLFWSMLPTT